MLGNLNKHWFLIALGVCFVGGYLFAPSLKPLLGFTTLRSSLVFVVMWLMGVTLHADAIRQSVRRPLPTVLAVLFNIALVPILCLPTYWLLPPSFFGGLFVTSLVPCTLASASVWTRKAGGDDSIAIMTTVVTNLACVVVIPVGLVLVLSKQVSIPVTDQVTKLALIVVLPLVLAQLSRRWGAAKWADRNKIKLSTIAQFGILVMVVFGAVAGATSSGNSAAPAAWISGIVLVIAAAAIHLSALWIGIEIARRTGNGRASQIAVGIAGSQKTLMVGLQIAIDCGVSVAPMLIYHLCQLVFDTIIASRWQAKSAAATQEEATLAVRNSR
jgi:sodium/bile acid cotransporter 7